MSDFIHWLRYLYRYELAAFVVVVCVMLLILVMAFALLNMCVCGIDTKREFWRCALAYWFIIPPQMSNQK